MMGLGPLARLGPWGPSASAYLGGVVRPPVDVRRPAEVSTEGCTKVVNAVHGMHAMLSVNIPRSVEC